MRGRKSPCDCLKASTVVVMTRFGGIFPGDFAAKGCFTEWLVYDARPDRHVGNRRRGGRVVECT
jgi:hypothetical protein